MLLVLGVGALQTLELLSGVKFTDVQSGNQIRLGVVDTAAVHITSQQHHIDQVRRAEEVGSAGPLVLLAGIQGGSDDGLGVDIVLAEVHVGAGALDLGAGSLDVHIVVDSVEVVILPDGTDMLLVDLVLVALFTAVADHDGGGDLLIERLAHHAVLVLDHIEIGDVDDVIPVHGIRDVDGLGVGGALDQLHVAGGDLALSLLVTMGPNLVVAGVHLTGADTADGALVNLVHDRGDPALVSGDQLGSARTQVLILGEQRLDIVDAVLQCLAVLLDIGLEGGLEGAVLLLLGVGQNGLLNGMAQDSILSVVSLVENIVLHGTISSFGMFHSFIVGLLLFLTLIVRAGIALGGLARQSSAEKAVHNLLLLLAHAVDHGLQGVAALAVILGIFLGLGAVVAIVITVVGVIKADALAGLDDDLLLSAFAVGHVHKVNTSPGVSSCHHEADFTNYTMNHITVLLLELIGVNGEGLHIAMLHQKLAGSSGFRLIKGAVGIDTVLPVLQQSVSQNIGRVVVLVVPYKRNHFPVTILKGVLADSPPICTYKVVSGSPATKVIPQLHFELFPPSVLVLFLRTARSDCCSGVRPPSGPWTASCQSSAESRSRS